MKRKGTYPSWLSVAFKLVLGALLFAFIYREISREADLAERWILLKQRWQGEGMYPLLFALALVPFNIGLEAKKWRKLMGTIFKFRPFLSVRAICTGLTVSLFTPNRIGEFAGRIVYLPGRFRVGGIFATFIGSLAQYVVYWMGAVAALFFGATELDWLMPVWHWLLLIGSAAVLLLLLIYFRSNHLLLWLRKKNWKAPFMRFLVISGRYPKTVLAQVLFFACLRYLVYWSQLYALMLFVGFPADPLKAVALIPLLFIAQTAVPSFVLTDLGVRGGLALFLFGPWAGSALLALLPSYMIWFMNVIFPAFVGWLSLMALRAKRKTEG